MLHEILTLQIFTFFMIFARVGTTFILMPGFSAPYVSNKIRLTAALAVSFVVTPILAESLPPIPSSPLALGFLLIGEILIGATIGTFARMMMGALQTTGTLIAYTSSMANAFVTDPVAEQQSSVFAGLLGTMGVLAVFATDMHYLMIRAVIESYDMFVPGQPLPVGDISNLLARRVADSFQLGVQLAMPVILTGLTYYIGLGLLGRLMPQLQVFFFGMPVQIMIQLSIFAITISSMMMVFLTYFEEGFIVFLRP